MQVITECLRLLSVVLAILLLLFPSLAHFCLVLPCVVLPYIVLGTLFLSFPSLDSTSGASSGFDRSTVSTVPTVSITAATGFGLLGVLSGTIGEALTDSATTLTLRQSLKAGHRDLALANHLTVLSSMSLAFWTQSKSERSINKQVLCMLLWAGCQVFRTAALPYLATGNGTSEAGYGRFLALAAMVFLDGEGLHGTVGTVMNIILSNFNPVQCRCIDIILVRCMSLLGYLLTIIHRSDASRTYRIFGSLNSYIEISPSLEATHPCHLSKAYRQKAM